MIYVSSFWEIAMSQTRLYHMSNLENPRFTERTSTNSGRSHRLPHVCTKMIYGKLGGLWAIWGGVLLEEVLCKSLFPHLPGETTLLHGQPACLAGHLYTATLKRALQLSGRTNPNAMALASFPGPCGPEPLPERMSGRMPVYLSIYLWIYLAS